MAITFQNRRGTSSQNDNFTGAQGEIVVDTTNEEIRLHNGVKQGGKILGGMPNEDTIASFRLMERVPEYIYVTGYHTKNDGAFGSHFFRLATDTGQVDNGGTIIRTVNGVYELQYEGAINVKWFIDALDASDDIGIQKALDFAASLAIDGDVYNRGVRPKVYGTSGLYTLSNGIRLSKQHSGLIIDFAGMDITRDSNTGSVPYGIHIEGADNWDNAVQYLVLKNITLRSLNAVSDGIYIKNGFYNHFENVNILGFAGVKTDYSGTYGIKFNGDAWSNTMQNVLIYKCWNGLFVGERCNSCNFIDVRIEFNEQYSLSNYKNNDNIFTNCMIEFTEKAGGVKGGDPVGVIGMNQAVSTKFHSCRFDGITGEFLITGVSGDDFFQNSIGTLFSGCYFTPHSTETPAYALKINRAKSTMFLGCNASKIKNKNNFSSAFVRLDTDAKDTHLEHCSFESTDPLNPNADLYPISDGSTDSSYTISDNTAMKFNYYESVPNNGVSDFYNVRAAADGASFRFYTRNGSGNKTERLSISGQTNNCLAKLSSGTSLYLQNGTYNDGYIRLGTNWLWVDSTGKLRIKSTTSPTSDTDGTIVGTQV